MTAPAPTPAEQAVIDRFGIFDEERIVEEVARAIHDADEVGNYPKTWPWEDDAEENRADYRRLAAAAVAAYRAMQDGGAEEAPPLGAPDESARVARAQADNGSGDWLGGPIG